MSSHGQVILRRMIDLIDRYEAGKLDLKPIVEQLGSMYDSLEPSEQPPDREWHDGLEPLKRAVKGGSTEDRRRVESQIRDRLAHLRRLIDSIRLSTAQAQGSTT